tara:strand:- start:7213 stop:7443 length:231 start_codon:yes stop_codon:yes gene_type:complete
MAPLYIRERLAELALLQNGWYDGEGRRPLRSSLRRAHERYREYDGPVVHLYPMPEGTISAEYELSLSGYQHEDEVL